MPVETDARRLRRAWQDGRCAAGVWSVLADPVAAELVAATPADYVCVDLQHGHVHEAGLGTLLQVMRAAGRAPLVRVGWNEPARIMRAIDAGASGVVVPLVSRVEDAVAAAQACRFPGTTTPGLRSWGPAWSDVRADGARPPQEQDDDVLCVVMVETPQAVESMADLCAVPGVDAVYVGPNDLALTCGHGRETYRTSVPVRDLLQRIVDTGREAGTPVGVHCSDVEMARDWRDRGAAFTTVAQDTSLLRAGVEAALAAVAG